MNKLGLILLVYDEPWQIPGAIAHIIAKAINEAGLLIFNISQNSFLGGVIGVYGGEKCDFMRY